MRKVLIVDDEKKIRDIYKRFLSGENFEVLEAGDGKEASSLLAQHGDIALILLDIRMPVMNGPALFNLIKLQKFPSKVIVTSVHPLDDQRRVLGGADGFFDKSEGLDTLLTRIKRVLPEGPAR
ncbi:MAG: response regulator [Candidatus Omnitrophica bacterium]|nr:response regulator [Candidatus Omnitrophota bacterium]